MSIARWCAVLAYGAVVGCGSPGMTAQLARVEAGMVESRVQAWSTAFANLNADSLATFYEDSPDLMVVWANGRRAQGFDENLQVMAEYFGNVEDMNFVVPSPTVHVLAPDVAVVTLRHSTDMKPAEQQERVVYAGYVTMVWTKDPADGVWRILMQQVSRNPA